MRYEDMVALVAGRIEEIAPYLDPAARARLAELSAELTEGLDDAYSREEAADRLRDLVVGVLPEGHEVREALLRGDAERYSDALPGATDWNTSAAGLRGALSFLSGGDPLWAEIRTRLLAAPALTPGMLPEHGGPHLIRLPRPDGGVQLPAFQFDTAGRVRPVVREVNALLDAERDPWGVADWWLGLNAVLGAAPADLLDAGGDDRVRAAARVVLEVE
ncbi:hypothetical protein [Actinomadura sp. DC4]|uniref:hypothetical protein n=1 Tax=Actinomadura sp. DC4 TaxID=3055069 RepID=UPI0025B15B85|nr:hypothetical protein [Actinomadura sp. DC4]MDN3353850.1 hypothetical protein [Actinomadura sp. DC4]